jgi:hypothetical protein
MTAVVSVERASLSDIVVVTPRAAGIGGSTVFLRAGERLTVSQLLRAMLVRSANDAAEMLAIHVGRGSTSRFVQEMNAKAAELGLSDTHFANPHGLDAAGHFSSARDTTVLVRYALGVPVIRDALSRTSVSLPGGREFLDRRPVDSRSRSGGKTGRTTRRVVARCRGAGTPSSARCWHGQPRERNRAWTLRLRPTGTVEWPIDAQRCAASETRAGDRASAAPSRSRTCRGPPRRRVVARDRGSAGSRGDRLGRVEVYAVTGCRLLDLVAASSVSSQPSGGRLVRGRRPEPGGSP